MAEMGSWNGHQFIVSPTLIRSFKGLTFTGSTNTDTVTSGEQDYVTRKSGKPIEISLTIGLNAMTGSDVRTEALAFVGEARDGAKNFFYIGDQKLMTCQLMLTKAAVTETTFAPNGKMLSAKVALTMQQASKNDGTFDSAPVNNGGGGDWDGGGGGGGGSSKKASVKKVTNTSSTLGQSFMSQVIANSAASAAAKSAQTKAQNTVNKVVSNAKAASKKK